MNTSPLSMMDWVYVMYGAISYLRGVEVIKLIAAKKVTGNKETQLINP